MYNIVCVNINNYCGQGVNYVNHLQESIGKPIICFTDSKGYNKDVEPRPIPYKLQGWYNKLYLFSGETGLTGTTIYLDLDTIILDASPLYELNDGFYALKDWNKPTINSSIMVFNHEGNRHIWEEYKRQGFPQTAGGDQVFINNLITPIYLQDKINGIYSYKKHCTVEHPQDTKIICFHGLPRPHKTRYWNK